MEKHRKTIQINPDFFRIGKKTRKQKQAKKRSDLRQTIKPNNLKKQLLSRIKNHQQSHKEKRKNNTYCTTYNKYATIYTSTKYRCLRSTTTAIGSNKVK